MDGEAHCAALARQSVTHHGEQRGTGHAGPGHGQDEAGEHEWPGRRGRVDGVPRASNANEDNQRSASAEPVGEPAARVLVGTIQEVAHRAVQPDREHRSAERLEVLGNEPLPQFLAQPEEEHGTSHGDYVPFQCEEVDQPAAPCHGYRPSQHAWRRDRRAPQIARKRSGRMK